MKGASLNMKNLNFRDVNWFALVGGALTLVLAVTSLSVPWWQLTVGQTLAKIGFSPVNLSMDIMGYSVALPIITAINWMFMVLLVFAGTVLAVYSFMPLMPYSKRLLTFAYKKPLATLIGFLIILLLITNSGAIVGLIIGGSKTSGADLNVPWSGAKTLQLPSSISQGVVSGVYVSAEVGWTFWLAVTVAGLCIAARIYHRKLERSTSQLK
jgi:hypothetical protein